MGKVLAAHLLAVALLAGCATPGNTEIPDDLPASKRAEIDAMPEVGDADFPGKPRETLGKVEGVSCKRSYWGQTPSWEETVRRTKYEALKKGANAIANLACDLPTGRSYIKLCLDSIRCTADAVRLGD
jgi:hypothetical protein